MNTGGQDDLRLIETLRWEEGAFVRLDRHMARLERSAAELGFALPAGAAAVALSEAVAPAGGAPRRVRLLLDRGGGIEVTQAPLGAAPARWCVALSPVRLQSGDPWLRHKTTRRAVYDATRAALPESVDEVLFANERGHLCEGTITNIFFRDGRRLCTPPLEDGCLPGCLRAEMLDQGACLEAPLPLDRLGRVTLFCGNSLRGLIPAALV